MGLFYLGEALEEVNQLEILDRKRQGLFQVKGGILCIHPTTHAKKTEQTINKRRGLCKVETTAGCGLA